ncbi:hypothetical protein FYJ43_00125 [Cutibacterium sp. WCA-380-WT-3A]|uniref:Cardiolipin synthase N-terminal domain-containing protein n=1 Tax=Cutibacterium porci TaxID=2605781 RepID=A0A7K0J3K1_9ACTN|nr:PLDc N-terminal domain-containing protein [Cutibacterium porci]MSS44498.1 hypothetical protein [Cutibacterium porci]
MIASSLFLILFALGTVISGIVFVMSLLSILRADHLTGTGKTIWIVICFCFPVVGPVVWFIAGRNAALS